MSTRTQVSLVFHPQPPSQTSAPVTWWSETLGLGVEGVDTFLWVVELDTRVLRDSLPDRVRFTSRVGRSV